MKILKGGLNNHPRGSISARKKKAIIIGATGATGAKLVRLLLDSDNWDKVTTISRRSVLEEKHDKLNEVIIDSFDRLGETFDSWKDHDSFFNCIGTTRKLGGGAKPFVDIEFGISLKCAELACNAGIPNASVISAGGANAVIST